MNRYSDAEVSEHDASDGFGPRARRKPQKYPKVLRGIATPPSGRRRAFMFGDLWVVVPGRGVMLFSLLSAAPAIGLVLAVAAAGGVGRDCLLLASNTVLAPRLFLVRMDRGAPWHSLTAADNALTAGALTGAAGVALLAGVGSAAMGWWHAAAPHPAFTMLILVASAVWCCIARGSVAGAVQEVSLCCASCLPRRSSRPLAPGLRPGC